MPRDPAPIEITLPPWVAEVVDWKRRYPSDEERMRLAIDLSRENVLRETGGPFGAAIFVEQTGELVGVGMNSVQRLTNATLHAEMVAFMVAQHRLGTFTLGAEGLPDHTLVTSCDPCAMCLGAVLWSGVRRVLCGASRDDATRLGFDEGPVFPESYRYLEDRGITILRGVVRVEARTVLELYRERGGSIYNG
ncbi:MAG: nucleoside deaminase [Gemmatimonadales bacterium]|nr:nucleoside deaminase [Gemmatimonadales bacterium]